MVITVLLFYVLLNPGETSNINSKQLVEKVFESRSRFVRPVLDANTTVNSSFGIELIQITAVDNRHQLLTTKCWVRQRWVNEFHQWNASQWNGLGSINIDADKIWIPDIVLYNNGADTFAGGTELYKTNIDVRSDGTSTWLAPATFISTCTIDIRYFPFDRQRCFLKFGSWTHDASAIYLSSFGYPLITSQYVNSTEWNLKQIKETVNSVKYACCPQPFIDITFEIILERKPLFYLFNIILPCLLLVITILFGFFLPPESGERISLTITILLALAVFLELVSDSLPRNSDTIPVLAIFFIVMMAETVFSLMTTCVILVIQYQSAPSATPMPLWIKNIIFGRLSYYLCIKRKEKQEREQFRNIHFISSKGDNEKFDNMQLQIRGTVNPKYSDICNQKESENGFTSGNVQAFAHLRQRIVHKRLETDCPLMMDKILNELRVITKKINEEQNNEEIKNDWIFLGRVLDRIFFIIFLLATCLSCLIIFLPFY